MSVLNYVIKSAFEGTGAKAAMNSINQMEKKVSSFSRSLNKMMGLMGGGAIGYGILRFANDTLGAYNEQEKATAKLNSALQSQGVYTASLSSKLHNQASAIQRVTTVGDEQALGLMQLGLTMGVTTDKIGDATKGAIGLSKSFGVDLNTSMKMVALAQAGNYTLLNRYIPQLQEMSSETEKAALVNKAMADGFKMAEAEAKTSGGRMEQLKNQIGDLKEVIGGHIVQIVDFWIPAIQKTVGWLEKLFNIGQEEATASMSRKEKELAAIRAILEVERNRYFKNHDYILQLTAAEKRLTRDVLAEAKARKAAAPVKVAGVPGLDPVEDAKATAARLKEVDAWYLSSKGIEEVRFYTWLHETKLQWDQMDLAQKEAAMLRIQEVHQRANGSMAGSFLLSIDRMKAAGMGWAQAWDGMWSGVLSGMTANVQTFLTSSGNMFKNFKKLLDGIFKSILNAFISMVAQMIAKWLVLQALTGMGGGGMGMRLLGSFSKGGPIPETGLYLLHKGEEVIPAQTANAVRKGGAGPSMAPVGASGGGEISLTQNINIGGTSETDINVVAQKLEEATRNGVMAAVNLSKVQYKVGLQRAGETAI